MKYLLILFTCLTFAQTPVKYFVVDCSQNTVVNSRIEVKLLIFDSFMLPMSYNSEIIIHRVSGNGYIVSPSTLTTRQPKENEQEPRVILKGCASDFPTLKIGKYVNLIYDCND